MHIKSIVLAAAAAAAAPVHPSFKVPTVEDAAIEARTLINRESLANLATYDEKRQTPVSFMEYYADCDDDGTLTLLSLAIGSSFRNIAAGSAASLSVRVGDHAVNDHVDPHYPGGIVTSPAGSPRISLYGKFEDALPEDHARLASCFLKRHPDAKWWLPGNPIHSSKWTQFKVEGAYFLGGFGDRAFIGDIPVDLYKSSSPRVTTMSERKPCKGKTVAQDSELPEVVEEFQEDKTLATIVRKLREQFLALFGTVEEQLLDVPDEPIHPNGHEQTVLFPDHEGKAPYVHGRKINRPWTIEEIRAAHSAVLGEVEQDIAEELEASVLERRALEDFQDVDAGSSSSQVPFIQPKRMSNSEAGRRLREIMEAQRAGRPL